MHISVQTVSSHTCIFGHVWVCTHILFFQACVHTNRYESGPKIVVEVEVASVLRSKTVFNKNWRNGVPNSNTALTGDLGQEGGLWPDRLVRLGPGMGGPPSLPPPLGQESAGKGGGTANMTRGKERQCQPVARPRTSTIRMAARTTQASNPSLTATESNAADQRRSQVGKAKWPTRTIQTMKGDEMWQQWNQQQGQTLYNRQWG